MLSSGISLSLHSVRSAPPPHLSLSLSLFSTPSLPLSLSLSLSHYNTLKTKHTGFIATDSSTHLGRKRYIAAHFLRYRTCSQMAHSVTVLSQPAPAFSVPQSVDRISFGHKSSIRSENPMCVSRPTESARQAGKSDKYRENVSPEYFVRNIITDLFQFGSVEAKAMTKPLERKTTTCEMRCVRKAVNKTRRDMILNTRIREMVGTKSIHHHIQQQRIKWFGHLTRLPIQHPAQRAYNTRFSSRKARGRPRKTLINGVKETLSLYNIPPAQAFRRAADKRLFLPAPPQVV